MSEAEVTNTIEWKAGYEWAINSMAVVTTVAVFEMLD